MKLLVSNYFGSAVFSAFAAGIYVSMFWVSNNITMLLWDSVLVIFLALVTPIVLVVLLIKMFLRIIGFQTFEGLACTFAIIAYVLLLLRLPILEIPSIYSLIEGYGGLESRAAKLFFVGLTILVSTIAAIVFHRKTMALSALFLLMAMTALVTSFSDWFMRSMDDNYAQKDMLEFPNPELEYRPNIYFILADSYSSFTYMADEGIDLESFRYFLKTNNFSLYNDFYSNYQTTAVAMPAILNMDHHYYQIGRKAGEVSASGRVIIGGKNNLARILKAAGYDIEYLHESTYLLLSGCFVDYCSPDVSLAGAKTVLHRILPNVLQEKRKSDGRSIEDLQQELLARISIDNTPRFFYMHFFSPDHSPNEVDGRCNEGVQKKAYMNRVSDSNSKLQGLVAEIVAMDRNAVIVLTSDHGPLIENNCSREHELRTVAEYRDRAGTILAIRWPNTYNGEYDVELVTSVNLFRYLLGSLFDDDSEIMDSLVADDVYTRASDGFQEILRNGEILHNAENISIEDMKKRYAHESRQ